MLDKLRDFGSKAKRQSKIQSLRLQVKQQRSQQKQLKQ
jgi:hypothetical protein